MFVNLLDFPIPLNGVCNYIWFNSDCLCQQLIGFCHTSIGMCLNITNIYYGVLMFQWLRKSSLINIEPPSKLSWFGHVCRYDALLETILQVAVAEEERENHVETTSRSGSSEIIFVCNAARWWYKLVCPFLDRPVIVVPATPCRRLNFGSHYFGSVCRSTPTTLRRGGTLLG